MATVITTTCDLCDKKIDPNPIRVEFLDGEHPHNGSRMYKTVDCCFECLSKLPLAKCMVELDDVRKSIKEGRRI